MKITASIKKKSIKGQVPLLRPVSLIILTYNHVQETIQLVESWFKYPLPSNAHIIFVDNASKDYTVDFLMLFDEIDEIIINHENLGFSKAVNQAIKMTSNDVVLLNNDIEIIQKYWLHGLQMTAYSSPDIGPVGCRLLKNNEVIHAGGRIDWETYRGENIHCELNDRREVLECDFVTFGCVYLKREVIERCGLLCEDYFMYCEDSDYCLEAKRKGFKIVMDGKINLTHHESASGNKEKQIIYEQSLEIFKGRQIS